MTDTHDDHVRRAHGQSAKGKPYREIAAHFNVNHVELDGKPHVWTRHEIERLVRDGHEEPAAQAAVEPEKPDVRTEVEVLRDMEAADAHEAFNARAYRGKSLWHLRAISTIVIVWALLTLIGGIWFGAYYAKHHDDITGQTSGSSALTDEVSDADVAAAGHDNYLDCMGDSETTSESCESAFPPD